MPKSLDPRVYKKYSLQRNLQSSSRSLLHLYKNCINKHDCFSKNIFGLIFIICFPIIFEILNALFYNWIICWFNFLLHRMSTIVLTRIQEVVPNLPPWSIKVMVHDISRPRQSYSSPKRYQRIVFADESVQFYSLFKYSI